MSTHNVCFYEYEKYQSFLVGEKKRVALSEAMLQMCKLI